MKKIHLPASPCALNQWICRQAPAVQVWGGDQIGVSLQDKSGSPAHLVLAVGEPDQETRRRLGVSHLHSFCRFTLVISLTVENCSSKCHLVPDKMLPPKNFLWISWKQFDSVHSMHPTICGTRAESVFMKVRKGSARHQFNRLMISPPRLFSRCKAHAAVAYDVLVMSAADGN